MVELSSVVCKYLIRFRLAADLLCLPVKAESHLSEHSAGARARKQFLIRLHMNRGSRGRGKTSCQTGGQIKRGLCVCRE